MYHPSPTAQLKSKAIRYHLILKIGKVGETFEGISGFLLILKGHWDSVLNISKLVFFFNHVIDAVLHKLPYIPLTS